MIAILELQEQINCNEFIVHTENCPICGGTSDLTTLIDVKNMSYTPLNRQGRKYSIWTEYHRCKNCGKIHSFTKSNY